MLAAAWLGAASGSPAYTAQVQPAPKVPHVWCMHDGRAAHCVSVQKPLLTRERVRMQAEVYWGRIRAGNDSDANGWDSVVSDWDNSWWAGNELLAQATGNATYQVPRLALPCSGARHLLRPTRSGARTEEAVVLRACP